MSISVRFHFSEDIQNDDRFTPAENEVTRKYRLGTFKYNGERYIIDDANGPCSNSRIGDTERSVCEWVPKEYHERTSIVHTFQCANLRRTGKYRMKNAKGEAEAVLTRRVPDDFSGPVDALLFASKNIACVAGDHEAVFDLLDEIRKGTVLPYEDWDAEQSG